MAALAGVLALSLGGVTLVAAGCGGDDGDAARSTATTATGPAPEPGLPPETAGYTGWARLNRTPIAADPDTPHGDVKNVYANVPATVVADARTARQPLPDGTVVVKSGSRGVDRAAVVAMMAKRTDVDPQHGDWVFTEYARTGPAEPYALLAEDSACWSCHAGASDTDWLFTDPR